MSIWNKCEKYNARPYFGFPLKVSFKDNIVTLHFPEGYKPNGDRVEALAIELTKLYGKLISVSKKTIKIKIRNDILASIIYKDLLDSNKKD